MIDEKHIQFIVQCLESYYERNKDCEFTLSLPAKEEPYDPEDGGVPPDMMDGEPNEEDWVRWRMLPSSVTEDDVLALEADFGTSFPEVFRAYLTSKHHLFEQMNAGKALVTLPPLPSDAPLLALRSELEGWRCLLESSYVPIAEYEDCQGPICFDMEAGSAEDAPLVWFDHEQLIGLGEESCGIRREVTKFAKPLYSGFMELMRDQFLQ